MRRSGEESSVIKSEDASVINAAFDPSVSSPSSAGIEEVEFMAKRTRYSSNSSGVMQRPLRRNSTEAPSTKQSSNFRGVYIRNNRFCAQVQRNGQKIYVGSYLNEMDAAAAYDAAARRLHGRKALCNFDLDGNIIPENLLGGTKEEDVGCFVEKTADANPESNISMEAPVQCASSGLPDFMSSPTPGFLLHPPTVKGLVPMMNAPQYPRGPHPFQFHSPSFDPSLNGYGTSFFPNSANMGHGVPFYPQMAYSFASSSELPPSSNRQFEESSRSAAFFASDERRMEDPDQKVGTEAVGGNSVQNMRSDDFIGYQTFLPYMPSMVSHNPYLFHPYSPPYMMQMPYGYPPEAVTSHMHEHQLYHLPPTAPAEAPPPLHPFSAAEVSRLHSFVDGIHEGSITSSRRSLLQDIKNFLGTSATLSQIQEYLESLDLYEELLAVASEHNSSLLPVKHDASGEVSYRNSHGPKAKLESTSQPSTKKTSYSIIVRDGVRLKGKLDQLERNLLDNFLHDIRTGVKKVRRRALAREIRLAVNPERPIQFFEKVVSRRRLNIELSAYLVDARAGEYVEGLLQDGVVLGAAEGAQNEAEGLYSGVDDAGDEDEDDQTASILASIPHSSMSTPVGNAIPLDPTVSPSSTVISPMSGESSSTKSTTSLRLGQVRRSTRTTAGLGGNSPNLEILSQESTPNSPSPSASSVASSPVPLSSPALEAASSINSTSSESALETVANVASAPSLPHLLSTSGSTQASQEGQEGTIPSCQLSPHTATSTPRADCASSTLLSGLGLKEGSKLSEGDLGAAPPGLPRIRYPLNPSLNNNAGSHGSSSSASSLTSSSPPLVSTAPAGASLHHRMTMH